MYKRPGQQQQRLAKGRKAKGCRSRLDPHVRTFAITTSVAITMREHVNHTHTHLDIDIHTSWRCWSFWTFVATLSLPCETNPQAKTQ